MHSDAQKLVHAHAHTNVAKGIASSMFAFKTFRAQVFPGTSDGEVSKEGSVPPLSGTVGGENFQEEKDDTVQEKT